jgi:EAL and modified HD-GYP domain-containing signal transduction protein
MMTESTFPLFVLQPVLGPKACYTAVRIVGPGIDDAQAVAALLVERGLAEAATGLQILLPASTIDALAGIDTGGAALHVDTHQTPPQAPAASVHSGPAAAVLLKLLSQLTGDADTRDIESTLKQDPQLSLQLLRLVNSAAFAPASRIASFSQAINLLGRRQLQRWLQLLMFARGQSPEQSNPLLPRAAMRAATMEALCKASGCARETIDEGYMVGMFSLLEPLFGKPLATILGTLQLAPEIVEALLQHNGTLGCLLKLVEAGDRSPEVVAETLPAAGVSTVSWCLAQVAALRWTQQINAGV